MFIDAGTVTADFNRWAGTPTASLVSTFSAFPFANLIAMLVGGVMTAALAVPNANPFGADNMFGYMNGKQMAWFSGLAFIFLYVNLGSVCSHCLYNAATGWSRIFGNHMRVMAIVLGASASSSRLETSGRSSSSGCHCLASLCRRSARSSCGPISDPAECQIERGLAAGLPFIAWAIGSICAFIVEERFPFLSTAISAALVGASSIMAIAKARGAEKAHG